MPAPALSLSYEFRDIQEAAEALPDLRLSYRQLERGPLHVSIGLQPVGEIMAATVALDRLVEGSGHVDSGQLLLEICAGGAARHAYDGHAIAPGQVFLKAGDTPPSQQLIRPDFRALLLTMPVGLLEAYLGRSLDDQLARGAVLDLASPALAAIFALIGEATLPEAVGQRSLSDLIVKRLCSGLKLESTNDLPARLSNRSHLAKAIRERLEECPEMTFGDICSALFISERTLRRVFSETYSMSPGQYHLTLRLNRVRDQLKGRQGARGAISEVAAGHGFWHMGRFSMQYRRLFGETPTQTLLAQGPRTHHLGPLNLL